MYLEIVREPGNTKDESEKEIYLGLVLKLAESTAKMRIKVKVIWPREGIENENENEGELTWNGF